MSALHDDILAALPGSPAEIAQRVGIGGTPLWDALRTLRQAGTIIRTGTSKNRLYTRAPEPEIPQGLTPPAAAKAEKKVRRRPVILFWIPGWPSQDPDRRMVWKTIWGSLEYAEQELKRLKARLGSEAEWEISKLTQVEVRNLRTRGYELREILDRKKMEFEEATARS